MQRRIKTKNEYHLLTALRALGFVGVSLFHRFSHIFPGGYLAVIIFLLLSGFLTMMGADNKKNIDFKKSLSIFINKYIKILGPVLFIMAIVMGFSLVFAREVFDDSIKSVIPVALNFENIQKILINEDYFNQLGNFNIFNHLWYVSMYMQFIAIFMVIDGFTKKLNDNAKLIVHLFITIVSFIIMISLGKNNSDITRIYNGIDTRISAFTFGVSLYLLNKNYLSKLKFSESFLKNAALFLGFLTIMPFFFVDGKDISSYKFIFIAYTLIVGLLTMVLFSYENTYYKARKIKYQLVSYIGNRSYYLYLWQYIVQILSVYFLHGLNKFLVVIIEILAIFILSELTYIIFKNKKINLRLIMISIFVLIGLRITSAKIGNAKEKEIAELRKEITANEELIKKRNEQAKKKSKVKQNASDSENNNLADKKDSIDEVNTKIIDEFDKEDNTNFEEKAYDDFEFTDNELDYLSKISITSIGDSVIINADSYIRKYIPNFYLDGEVGRDMVSGPEILSAIKENVGLADIVVISLGSNGSANHSDMDKIMEIADGRDIYFVNTSHTQSYMDYVNNSIKEYCDSHDKAHMVDWRNYIKDKPDYLAADRTHPNIPGSDAFAKLIMRKILNVNKIAP